MFSCSSTVLKTQSLKLRFIRFTRGIGIFKRNLSLRSTNTKISLGHQFCSDLRPPIHTRNQPIVYLWSLKLGLQYDQRNLFQQDSYRHHIFHCYTSPTAKGFFGRNLELKFGYFVFRYLCNFSKWTKTRFCSSKPRVVPKLQKVRNIN